MERRLLYLGFWQRTKLCLRALGSFAHSALEVLYGVIVITRMPQPIVAVFGGSRVQPGSEHAKNAFKAGKLLVQKNISVVTGGGPGIMESANCGAAEVGRGRSTGVVFRKIPGETNPNACAQSIITTSTFFARKYLLINYALGFLIFPGGYGTLDELSELLNLMRTNQRERVPIILIGSSHWAPFLEWIHASVEHQFVAKGTNVNIVVTDSIEEAVTLVSDYCAQCMNIVPEE